ncbi:MAG TPA: HD domain-containing phosphohydrolase, partial [Dehalococcoidia bacterium]
MSEESPRLAELVGGLSLATDLGAGLGMETALRTCLLAVELGRGLGVQGEALRDVYYTALLRFIGCTAYAHETAAQFGGDDLALLGALAPIDTVSAGQLFGTAFRATRQGGLKAQLTTVVNLARDPKGGAKLAAAHCDLAVALAARLGMSEGVVAALGQIYERFDGRGSPAGLEGEQISMPACILHLAWRVEVHRAMAGPQAAIDVAVQRAGSEFDPIVVNAFLARATELLALLDGPSVWDAFLSAEPRPFELMTP